ncbi:MAG: hypothetical protein ABIQ88_14030 [Chitinophagaceae bacterium]
MDTSQFKPKTLQQVRDAMEAVEVAGRKRGLSASDKIALQTVSLTLHNMERTITESIENKLVEDLTRDSNALKDLTEKILAASKKLEKLAGILETTAKVVDGFVKIVSVAFGAGLL